MPNKKNLGKVFDKIELNFQVIETYDPLYLTIADYSKWGGIIDKVSAFQITLPASKQHQSFYFDKLSLNVFDSNALGLTIMPSCGESKICELPDGLYKLKLIGSPDKYFKERRYLRTTKTQLSLDKLLIKFTKSCDSLSKVFVEKICEANVLLRAAEANVRYDNICEANELLFKVQDIIKNELNPCKKCDE